MEAESHNEAGPVRVLEFYSGIGGFHTAIDISGIRATVVAAFDINTNANLVYEKNFGIKVNTKSIESLTAKDLDAYKADFWLLSPPCQPYTRQGKMKDSEDPRAASFLHLIRNVFPKLQYPPARILIENVVNFESSQTRQLFVGLLTSLGYDFQEFHLSPLQFNIPNSRTRYFCLAKRRISASGFAAPEQNGKLSRCIPAGCKFFPDGINSAESECKQQLSSFLEHETNVDEYLVPADIVVKEGNRSDIVFPDSQRCCCFTKAYGSSYVLGTGSLIQMAPKEVQGDASDPTSLLKLKLRYFTPAEICRLHGFDEKMDWAGLSRRQQYALLGNSLNAIVVAELIKYLFVGSHPGASASQSALSCN